MDNSPLGRIEGRIRRFGDAKELMFTGNVLIDAADLHCGSETRILHIEIEQGGWWVERSLHHELIELASVVPIIPSHLPRTGLPAPITGRHYGVVRVG